MIFAAPRPNEALFYSSTAPPEFTLASVLPATPAAEETVSSRRPCSEVPFLAA